MKACKHLSNSPDAEMCVSADDLRVSLFGLAPALLILNVERLCFPSFVIKKERLVSSPDKSH
ncbi:hypothetical protein [Vibrio salinus]|uniref:hypothetical protein n=1 Tax=Vibrio salinus TaxID=2899784 RepID=UPI001E563697|nr:hypothetical protein [Vibrio salinus]MCE0495989.1 hypothetical protein [Vibrio salinus]